MHVRNTCVCMYNIYAYIYNIDSYLYIPLNELTQLSTRVHTRTCVCVHVHHDNRWPSEPSCAYTGY